MVIKRNSVLLAFMVMVIAFSGSQPSQSISTDLIANLIIPISTPDGKRVLSMDRYPRFHVQLVNISDKTLRVWKDWNSWGWFNLSLKMETQDGATFLKKKPVVWDGDFSDFWQIEPGESVIMEIDMTSGVWEGFPDLYGESLPVKLTAIYQNKADPLCEVFGIWTGSASSNTVQVEWR